MCNKYSEEEVEFFIAEIKDLKEKMAAMEKEIAILKSGKTGNLKPIFKPNNHTKHKSPGAKDGHKGHNRPIPEHIDEIVELKTDKCPDCNTDIQDVPASEINERYKEDIEPAKAKATKYIMHRKYCPCCKKLVSEKPKDVVPKCRFGFNLMLFLMFCKYILLLPLNKIQTMLKTVYGLSISEGTIINELDLFANALGDDFNKILEDMKKESYINGDETGHRIHGENHWLWVFISKTRSLFLIRKGRGSDVPKEVLGNDFKGIFSSDFWNAYNWIENQQKCWAHVLKNAKALEDDYVIFRILKKLYRKAEKISEETDSAKKEKAVSVFIRRMETLKSIPLNTKKAKAFVKTITKHKRNLFLFVTNKDVEATNNAAERALRPLVVMRKISYGNMSDKGARTLETNISVIKTWNLQGKDFFDAGRQCLQAFASRR
jgi:transposase